MAWKNLVPATALIIIPFLTGCGSSGPVAIGPDTYMAADTGGLVTSYSGGALKAGLYQQANAFCRAQGREVMPVNATGNNAGYAQWAHAEIEFRCLSPGDPELRRPRFKPAPNVLIETRPE